MPSCSRASAALSTPEQLAWLGFIATSMARFYRFHTIQDFAGGQWFSVQALYAAKSSVALKKNAKPDTGAWASY